MAQTDRLFDERKATQIAAQFLTSSPDHSMPYMKLLKLMYIADREAINRWEAPIIDDAYYALDHGMVLSQVKDLIDGVFDHGAWAQAISAPSEYVVRLIADPGDDELSVAESELVREIYAQYGTLTQWQLSELTHTFAEWKDPSGSAIPVSIRDIMTALGFDSADADEAIAELESARRMHKLAS